MGIVTYMITGDNEKTAKSVAEAVGIDNVISNVLPEDKLNKVKDLQKKVKKYYLLVMELMMHQLYLELMLV